MKIQIEAERIKPFTLEKRFELVEGKKGAKLIRKWDVKYNGEIFAKGIPHKSAAERLIRFKIINKGKV